MSNPVSLKLFASGRLIYLRWFSLAGLLAILGLFSNFNLITASYVISPVTLAIWLILALSLINFLLWLIYRFIYLKPISGLVNVLSLLQIVIDIFAVFSFLALFGYLSPFLILMWLYPLAEAIVLFKSLGSIIISLGLGLTAYSLKFIAETKLMIAGDTVVLKSVLNSPLGDEAKNWLFMSLGIIVSSLFLIYVFSLVKQQGLFLLESGEKKLKQKQIGDEAWRERWLNKFSLTLDENKRTLRAKELELALAYQKLNTLEHAKAEFISISTHQMRTPLAAIKWTFNMMLSEQLGKITEEQKNFLDKGYQGTLRLINIVNNLVHIDHDEANKDDYNFQATNLADFLKDISGAFSNQAESKKINLTINQAASNLPMIELDQNKMRMVLENLIDNAMKYTPREGQVSLIIKDDRLNSAEPAIELMIKDTGVGIPVDEQKKIFHKFYRASNARRQEPDGSGIGLFIAKDIVENHSGTIWFDSVENKGTTFHIVLPVRQKIKNKV